ncbi:MAG: hypothetical protein SFX73_37050 [Kofleriaceae bacterium]|nr:hypothetical protein [Kofleriaceae bacterium]
MYCALAAFTVDPQFAAGAAPPPWGHDGIYAASIHALLVANGRLHIGGSFSFDGVVSANYAAVTP